MWTSRHAVAVVHRTGAGRARRASRPRSARSTRASQPPGSRAARPVQCDVAGQRPGASAQGLLSGEGERPVPGSAAPGSARREDCASGSSSKRSSTRLRTMATPAAEKRSRLDPRAPGGARARRPARRPRTVRGGGGDGHRRRRRSRSRSRRSRDRSASTSFGRRRSPRDRSLRERSRPARAHRGRPHRVDARAAQRRSRSRRLRTTSCRTESLSILLHLRVDAGERSRSRAGSRSELAMRDLLPSPTDPFLSRHAKLREVTTHVVGPMCHVLWRGRPATPSGRT